MQKIASPFTRNFLEGFVSRCMDLGMDANATEELFHKYANNQFLATPNIYEGMRERLSRGDHGLTKAALAKYLTPDVLALAVDCRVKYANDFCSAGIREMLGMPEPSWDTVPEPLRKTASHLSPTSALASGIFGGPIGAGLHGATGGNGRNEAGKATTMAALLGAAGLGAGAIAGHKFAPNMMEKMLSLDNAWNGTSRALRMADPEEEALFKNITAPGAGALAGGAAGVTAGSGIGAAVSAHQHNQQLPDHGRVQQLLSMLGRHKQAAAMGNAINQFSHMPLQQQVLISALLGSGIGAGKRALMPSAEDQINQRGVMNRMGRGALHGGAIGAGAGLGAAGGEMASKRMGLGPLPGMGLGALAGGAGVSALT